MRSVLARFMSKVSPEPNTGCWLWTGGGNRKGYGTFNPGGRSFLAHRWAYEASVGRCPPDLYVLHRCSVRCCVNPAHLYAGDQIQNMKDREAAGNAPRGERGGRAKLTDMDAEQARLMAAIGGVPASALAPVFGMSHKGIGKVLSGERFWHLGPPTLLIAKCDRALALEAAQHPERETT